MELNESSLTTQSKSSFKTNSILKSNKSIDLTNELNQLTIKIQNLRKLRQESKQKSMISLSTLSKPKPYQVKPIKRKYDFQHPNLEFVLGELVLSPYMTKPLDPYPKSTLKGIKHILDLKHQGKKFNELNNNDKPYDVNEIRQTFIKEVIDSPDFFMPQSKYKFKPIERPSTQLQSRERSISPLLTNESSITSNKPSTYDHSNNNNNNRKQSRLKQKINEKINQSFNNNLFLTSEDSHIDKPIEQTTKTIKSNNKPNKSIIISKSNAKSKPITKSSNLINLNQTIRPSYVDNEPDNKIDSQVNTLEGMSLTNSKTVQWNDSKDLYKENDVDVFFNYLTDDKIDNIIYKADSNTDSKSNKKVDKLITISTIPDDFNDNSLITPSTNKSNDSNKYSPFNRISTATPGSRKNRASTEGFNKSDVIDEPVNNVDELIEELDEFNEVAVDQIEDDNSHTTQLDMTVNNSTSEKLLDSKIDNKVDEELNNNVDNNIDDEVDIYNIADGQENNTLDVKIDNNLDIHIDSTADKQTNSQKINSINSKKDIKIDIQIDRTVDKTMESPKMNKFDSPKDNKKDSKIDSKKDSRIDNKIVSKIDIKIDSKDNSKKTSRGANTNSIKKDLIDKTISPKTTNTPKESKSPSKSNKKIDSKVINKTDNKSDKVIDSKFDSKIESKVENKTDIKINSKLDTESVKYDTNTIISSTVGNVNSNKNNNTTTSNANDHIVDNSSTYLTIHDRLDLSESNSLKLSDSNTSPYISSNATSHQSTLIDYDNNTDNEDINATIILINKIERKLSNPLNEMNIQLLQNEISNDELLNQVDVSNSSKCLAPVHSITSSPSSIVVNNEEITALNMLSRDTTFRMPTDTDIINIEDSNKINNNNITDVTNNNEVDSHISYEISDALKDCKSDGQLDTKTDSQIDTKIYNQMDGNIDNYEDDTKDYTTSNKDSKIGSYSNKKGMVINVLDSALDITDNTNEIVEQIDNNDINSIQSKVSSIETYFDTSFENLAQSRGRSPIRSINSSRASTPKSTKITSPKSTRSKKTIGFR